MTQFVTVVLYGIEDFFCCNPFLEDPHTSVAGAASIRGMSCGNLFDFAAAAQKIGMLMTVDGTCDDLICIDGVDKDTFTEADAG